MKKVIKDLAMFKLFTKPVSQYITGKRLLVISISICLLFAASALCSSEAHYGLNSSDAGDPDLSDPDETPSDIGAVRMGDHQHEIYEMPTGLVSSGIKWMSFPVINKITAGYNVSQNFFEPIVDPEILDWVQ